jgi:hypothetical protein
MTIADALSFATTSSSGLSTLVAACPSDARALRLAATYFGSSQAYSEAGLQVPAVAEPQGKRARAFLPRLSCGELGLWVLGLWGFGH